MDVLLMLATSEVDKLKIEELLQPETEVDHTVLATSLNAHRLRDRSYGLLSLRLDRPPCSLASKIWNQSWLLQRRQHAHICGRTGAKFDVKDGARPCH
jgi:hypothetical protein